MCEREVSGEWWVGAWGAWRLQATMALVTTGSCLVRPGLGSPVRMLQAEAGSLQGSLDYARRSQDAPSRAPGVLDFRLRGCYVPCAPALAPVKAR